MCVEVDLDGGFVYQHRMNLSQLTSADLVAIGKLLHKRDVLLAEIAKIDADLSGYEAGKPPKKAPGKVSLTKIQKVVSKKRSSQRKKGSIREGVESVLKKAGKAGMHINNITKEMDGNLGSLRQWFATSAKKIKNIKRVGPATYRLEK